MRYADLRDFDRRASPGAWDLVTTFDAVHDQAKPLNVSKGIHRTLKPEGVYLMVRDALIRCANELGTDPTVPERRGWPHAVAGLAPPAAIDARRPLKQR